MPLIPEQPPQSSFPPGATDCHMHIYGDLTRYPMSPTATVKPIIDGTVDTYLQLMKALGIERTVVVQPSAYGTDNRCTLDAMARIGANARGVAVIDEGSSDAEIARLTALGIRGIRYYMLSGGALSWESLPRMAARVAEHGWHVQMQMDGRFLHEREAELSSLPGRLVIDHNGKFLEPVALDHPGVSALRRLLERGRTHVKVSGIYETSKDGPPYYADVAKLGQLFVGSYPERCLWATNWPHPTKPADPPDDSNLADVFAGWCASEAVRKRILVENPTGLYGF